MRNALAFVLASTIAAGAAQIARAQTGPQIVVPTRPGVPVYINGYDASWGVVEGDWGLERSIHVVPTVTYGPAAYQDLPPVGHYYPSFGIQPGYGRKEIEPTTPRRRRAESYSRSWGTESAPTPAQLDPPVNPPAIIYAPQDPRRPDFAPRRPQHLPR